MSSEAIAHVWSLELQSAEERTALIWIANASGGLGYPVSPEWISVGAFMTCGFERACEVVHDLADRGLLRWGGREPGDRSWLWITYDGVYLDPIDWTEESKGRKRRVAALIERDGPDCAYCDGAPVNYEVDHFIPRAKGGLDVMGNLVLSCSPCNRAKRDKMPQDFLAEDPERFRALSRRLNCLRD